MKPFITTIFVFSLSLIAYSQVPQGFNYQAVIRDANGDILPNEDVSLRFKLFFNIQILGDFVVYSEIHTTTTNEFGMVNVVIGDGTVVTGLWDSIIWGATLQLRTEVNLGNGYVDMGSHRLQSVPYAIRADDVEGGAWKLSGNAGTDETDDFIGTTDIEGLSIKTNNIDRMYFRANSAQVGIGTKFPGWIEQESSEAFLVQSGNLIHIRDTVDASSVILEFVNDELKKQLIMRVDDDASTIKSSNEIPMIITTGYHDGLYLEPGGNVGIYTENPYTKLHIVNGSDASLTGHGYLITGEVDDNNIVIDNNEIIARNNGATSPLYINGNGGNVAIGQTSTPSWQLTVSGTAAKPGGGSWTATSDARLKSNVVPYASGLNEVMKINPITYQYIENTGHDTNIEYVGVLAQELQKVAPEMVAEAEMELADGTKGNYLSVDPSAFTYMLINAVQELKMENESLKQELTKSELDKSERLQVLESRMAELEKILLLNAER
jgi:hypothetical protein